MSTALSITFTDDGLLQMQITGKFTGHIARKGFEILRGEIEQGMRNIKLDLTETTSIDSIGAEILRLLHAEDKKRVVSALSLVPDCLEKRKPGAVNSAAAYTQKVDLCL